jgi:hypothetical protein
MKMKVYRNARTPKVIGVKFDNMRNSMVTIAADGEIDTGVTVEFVDRDRKVAGDLNADPDFMKVYDPDFSQMFADMLDICEADKSSSFKLEHDDKGHSVHISKGGDIENYDALVERLKSLVRILG